MYDLACNRPHTRRIFGGLGFRTCDQTLPLGHHFFLEETRVAGLCEQISRLFHPGYNGSIYKKTSLNFLKSSEIPTGISSFARLSENRLGGPLKWMDILLNLFQCKKVQGR
ncbi:hypothetical protein AVEN_172202-1 [Araneus ventricosus]|uniref:Uncharacterized protein n=1 Tax=Araneus ventricosus TaxID=182803 RepID=A0A4Y2WSF6_ARAVE|nr:hypothetical protein AVEN_172202-1 [Araneus ventricosus]